MTQQPSPLLIPSCLPTQIPQTPVYLGPRRRRPQPRPRSFSPSPRHSRNHPDAIHIGSTQAYSQPRATHLLCRFFCRKLYHHVTHLAGRMSCPRVAGTSTRPYALVAGPTTTWRKIEKWGFPRPPAAIGPPP